MVAFDYGRRDPIIVGRATPSSHKLGLGQAPLVYQNFDAKWTAVTGRLGMEAAGAGRPNVAMSSLTNMWRRPCPAFYAAGI